MAYQSLYRKYRPQRFADLVGQRHVTIALQNAVRDGRVGHAYLFSGPRGTGKTTSARILAKALNCTNLGANGDPCGVCESCVAIADGTSLDVFEVDAASKRGIDEMRDLLGSVAYLTAGGARKVYILDEAHMLTPQAEAALLKTLEESPEHVVFVLATTDPTNVAPTIRSRTQHYVFTLYSVDEIQQHLESVCAREGVEATPEALAIIARAAAGSMRDSLSLLDQAIAHGPLDVENVSGILGGTTFGGRVDVLQHVVDEDVAGALLTLEQLLETGHEPRRLAEDLLTTARDAFLLSASKGDSSVDVAAEDTERLARLGEDAGVPQLIRIMEELGEAVVDMRGIDAADPRLVLEIALVRLARRNAGPPLQVLAERVERLERTLREGEDGLASTSPSPVTTTTSAAPDEAQAGGSRPSFRELRERAAAAPPAAPPSTEPAPAPAAAPAPEPAAAREIELDDVILVWGEMVPGFPPATRAAAQEAQPIALTDNVVTFGVPKNLIAAAEPRFKKEADNIRSALTERLGRVLKFRLEPVAGFGDLSRVGGTPTPAATTDGVDEAGVPYPDDDVLDLAELTDAPGAAAVDSVSMIASQFDATVVEEVPRD